MTDAAPLLTTPLTALHRAAGARMAGFAGYDMPIQYAGGIIAEHTHTRTAAGLFDVSHMGQCLLEGGTAAATLEQLTPGDIKGLAVGRMRYSVFLTASGGISDDLMILRLAEDRFFVVVNASRKTDDFALLKANLLPGTSLTLLDDRALLALQGPEAKTVLSPYLKEHSVESFLTGSWSGDLCVTRSGYTGEDGFEISLPAPQAAAFAQELLSHDSVKWIGLGARDSLRLEAGLCLYGHELDETTSPVEADLAWVIGKRRREAGDFPGSARILKELAEGCTRKRVGIKPEGRAIAREQTVIQDNAGQPIGLVTSGGFGPTLGGPIAMGYVAPSYASAGSPLFLNVRGQALPATVTPLPFVPHTYKR